ncbi:hypothetical protein ABIC21_000605 [Pseudarthrobacter sp. PvP090]
MQNRVEHKKVCGKWVAQTGSAPAAAGLPHTAGDPRRARGCGSGGGPQGNPAPAPGYWPASSVETSFRETELMQ